MNSLFITIKKELRSIFRDKKTLVMLFILPLMIPAFIMLYGYMFDSLEDEVDDTSKIGLNFKVDNIQKELMKNNNIEYVYYDNKNEMESDFENDDISGYLVYSSKKDMYYIHADTSSNTGTIIVEKVSTFLDNYNDYLATNYLQENHMDLDKVYNNVKYSVVEKDEENYLLKLIYDIAFTYTIMSIVLAASNMAMSSTASEKENGTLETILTLPVDSKQLILGKHIAGALMGVIVSTFSLFVTVLGLFIGCKLFTSFEDFNFHIGVGSVLCSFVILIAASILISGLAISLTAFCKTNKEAQSKTQVLSFISMIPMFVSLLEIKLSAYFYLIPVCNYTQSLLDIFNGNILALNILLTFGSSIVYIAIIIARIIKQYKSEKVLFG